MTDYAAANYISDNARTEGEAKQFFEDLLAAVKEMPGGGAIAELTISSGVVTPTKALHSIDTQGNAAADDLDTIVQTNHPDGRLLIVRCEDASRVVTLKHLSGGTGQIRTATGDHIILDALGQYVGLVRCGTEWREVFRTGSGATVHAGDVIRAALTGSTPTMPAIDGRNLKQVGSYILLTDEKAAATHGGSSGAAGVWTTRDLNQEKHDIAGICTLAANQFSLPAGTYQIRASAPACKVYTHMIKLRNITDAADVLHGTSAFEQSGLANTRSEVSGQFTIAGTKTFEIQHAVHVYQVTYGFGYANYDVGQVETFTTVELWKVA